MPATAFADDVTPAQRDQYEAFGWTVMPGFFSRAEAAEIGRAHV